MDEELEKIGEMIQRSCHMLAEHCDTVQIIATVHGEESHMLHYGQGNGYARAGSVRDWLMMCDTKVQHDTHEEMNDE